MFNFNFEKCPFKIFIIPKSSAKCIISLKSTDRTQKVETVMLAAHAP